MTSMVSQILRHVTFAVTKAQENETEITEIYFFYSSCRKETDKRKQKQADSISVKGGTCSVIPWVRAHSHAHLRSGAWLEGLETHHYIKSFSSNSAY